jgi:hypothetical protein
MTTPQSGDPIGTPRGFGRVLLVWGNRVRVGYCDNSRATYDLSECQASATAPRPSATVIDFRTREARA